MYLRNECSNPAMFPLKAIRGGNIGNKDLDVLEEEEGKNQHKLNLSQSYIHNSFSEESDKEVMLNLPKLPGLEKDLENIEVLELMSKDNNHSQDFVGV